MCVRGHLAEPGECGVFWPSSSLVSYRAKLALSEQRAALFIFLVVACPSGAAPNTTAEVSAGTVHSAWSQSSQEAAHPE